MKTHLLPFCPRVYFHHIHRSVLVALAFMLALAARAATEVYWRGPALGSADFNIRTNWSSGSVPQSTAYDCDDDNGSNSIVLIQTGDPGWTPNDIRAGNEANDSGQFIQSGSTNKIGGWFRLGVSAGSAGYYTLNGGTLNYQGGDLNVGELGTGVLNINGGVITGSGNFADDLGNNDNPAITDVVNQTAGLVQITGQLFVGNGGNAVYNLSGGTNTVANWIAIGRTGGSGVLNMTGGVLNQRGGTANNFDIGTGYAAPAGTSASGILNQSGGLINCQAQLWCPEVAPSTGTYSLSGNAVLNAHDWIAIGRSGATGVLNITNSAVISRDNTNDAGANFSIGNAGPGTVNQDGGFVTNLAGSTFIGQSSVGTWNLNSGVASLGNVIIADLASANGTLNLNGGLLQASGLTCPSTGGVSEIDFNGGIVQAMASNPNFISGMLSAGLSLGGVIFDSQSYNIVIPQVLADNGGGGITKIGPGTLTLSGANSYLGPTIVSNGTLNAGTTETGGGAYSVADHAALGIIVQSAGSQLVVADATLGSTTGATLDFNLGAFGNPPTAPLVASTLAVNGVTTVNIADTAAAVGQFSLISYGSRSGSGSFVLGTLPPGTQGYLSNNAANSSLDLVVTSAGAPEWMGTVNNLWDINTTANWFDLGTQQPTTYHDGAPVLFNDAASGSTTVSLNTTVNPGSLTFANNNLPYTLVGTGRISGPISLVVQGTGSVAIENTGGNSYTGPTLIEGGVLSVTNVANGGLPSPLGASSASPTNWVIASGTFTYAGAPETVNRGVEIAGTNSVVDAEGDLTLGGGMVAAPAAVSAISSTIKAGPAQLALANVGTNTFAFNYDPALQVIEGTLLLDGSAGLQTNHVLNELYVGNTPNFGAALVLSNTTLEADSWLAVGRGNGAVSNLSTVTLCNSTATVASVSLGFDAGLTNLSQQVLTLNGASTLTVNGPMNLGESGGNTTTININGTSLLAAANRIYLPEGADGPSTASMTIAGAGQLSVLGGYWFSVGSGAGSVGSLLVENTGSVWDSGDFNVTDVGAGKGATMIRDNAVLHANNLYVGKSAGSVGTLTITNHAAVVSSNAITLGLNGGSSGTVNLGGGSLAVSAVVGEGGPSISILNFNGGTLTARNPATNFISNLTAINVLAGGAFIDNSGSNVVIAPALLNGGGGGGLTTLGRGTFYLNGASTYTGPTLVSAGTLAGVGSIAGPVIVPAGGTLAAGTANAMGTLTINNTLSLAPGSTTWLRVSPINNDEIVGLTGVSYGGALVLTNTSSTALSVGRVFQLFRASTAGTGNFGSITLLGGGTASFDPATGLLTIGPATPPTLNPPVWAGGNMVLSGSGGTPNTGYTVLSTTNLALPLAAWITNGTGVFGAAGTFTNSILATPAQPARFFDVRAP